IICYNIAQWYNIALCYNIERSLFALFLSAEELRDIRDTVGSDVRIGFTMEVTQNVNIQVRQREPSSPEKSRSKLDLLREQTSGAIREGLDNLKRPLTGLLRRPGSRTGSRERPPAASHAFIDTPHKNDNAGNTGTADTQAAASLTASKKVPGADSSSWLSGRPSSRAGKQAVVKSSMENDDGMVTTTMVESSALTKDVALDDPMANLEEGFDESTTSFLDLTLLSKCLCPEDEVKDEQVPWTWDYLYTTVCSELRQEWGQGAGDALEGAD
uniref:Uncharacterized protein n=1 Tax=Romanomermis culicivorax TaxID=13658 RepID=A0A915K9B9_ROMCU